MVEVTSGKDVLACRVVGESLVESRELSSKCVVLSDARGTPGRRMVAFVTPSDAVMLDVCPKVVSEEIVALCEVECCTSGETLSVRDALSSGAVAGIDSVCCVTNEGEGTRVPEEVPFPEKLGIPPLSCVDTPNGVAVDEIVRPSAASDELVETSPELKGMWESAKVDERMPLKVWVEDRGGLTLVDVVLFQMPVPVEVASIPAVPAALCPMAKVTCRATSTHDANMVIVTTNERT